VAAGRTAPENISRIERSKSAISRGVWLSRYLSTKADTPCAASARATSDPSFSIDSVRKPPPGATITAAPVALAGSARYGVSVATVTLRANALPYWRCQDSGTVAPGSGPVPSTIASAWAGVAIGVMVSSWAFAGAERAQLAASAAAVRRTMVQVLIMAGSSDSPELLQRGGGAVTPASVWTTGFIVPSALY
jgi:hypothetical protein